MLNILQAIKSAPDELNSLDFIWYFYCFICKLHCIVFVFIPELVIWNDAGEFLELYVFDQVIIFSPKEKVLRGHKIKRQSKNSLTLTHGGWLVIQVENHFHVKGNWQRRYISRNNIGLNDMLIVARGVILTQEKVFFSLWKNVGRVVVSGKERKRGKFLHSSKLSLLLSPALSNYFQTEVVGGQRRRQKIAFRSRILNRANLFTVLHVHDDSCRF